MKIKQDSNESDNIKPTYEIRVAIDNDQDRKKISNLFFIPNYNYFNGWCLLLVFDIKNAVNKLDNLGFVYNVRKKK